MKKTNYQKKPTSDLQKALTEKREILANFRFGISGSRTKNVKQGRSTRRDIARILTALAAGSRGETLKGRPKVSPLSEAK